MNRKKRNIIERPNFNVRDRVIVEERSFSRIIGKRVSLEAFIPELDLDLLRIWNGRVSKVLSNRCYDGLFSFHERPYYEIVYDPNQNNGVRPPQYAWEIGLHTTYIKNSKKDELSS